MPWWLRGDVSGPLFDICTMRQTTRPRFAVLSECMREISPNSPPPYETYDCSKISVIIVRCTWMETEEEDDDDAL